MSEMIQVPKGLLPLVVSFVKQSSALLREAGETMEAGQEKTAAVQEALTQKAAAAVKECIESGLMSDAAKESAIGTLSTDHATALASLEKVARDIRPFSTGGPSPRSGDDGGTDGKSAADSQFEQKLGFTG